MKKYMRWVGMALMSVTLLLWAKDKRARSYDSFYNQLAKSPYAVVLLYDKSKETMRDKYQRENIKSLEIMFKSLSDNPTYKDAQLLFLRVDNARDNNLAQALAITQFPTLKLYRGRDPIAGTTLQGNAITRTAIIQLIDRFLGKQLDTFLKEKDEERKRELERAKIRAYNRAAYGPYWYGSYGYPFGPCYGPAYWYW